MPIQTVSQAFSNEGAGGFTFRNRVINGDMRIDQRNNGSALAAGLTAAGAYTMDRWASFTGTGSLWQMQRVSTGNLDFPFAMRIQRIAGQTSTSAVYVAQIIETNNTYGLAGQTVTLSFYITAGSNYSGGSSFGFQLINGTGSDEGMSSMNSATWTGAVYPGTTLTPTTTRTRITFTTTLGASVQEVAVRFYWAGSGTAGANDFVDITGVQLELGSVATPFERRPYGTELQLCQRYYEKTVTNTGLIWTGDATNNNNYYLTGQFVVLKRATPTFTATGTGGTGFSAGSAADAGANAGEWNMGFTCNSTGVRRYFTAGWTASAEL